MPPLQPFHSCVRQLGDVQQSLGRVSGLLHPRYGHSGQQQQWKRARLTPCQALRPTGLLSSNSICSICSSSIRSHGSSLQQRSLRCYARKSKQQQQDAAAAAADPAADAPERIMLQVQPSDGENPVVYVGFDPETMELVPKYVLTEELLDGLDGVDAAQPGGAAAADAAAAEALQVRMGVLLADP